MKTLPLLEQIKTIEHGFLNAHDSSTLKNPILMNQVHSVDVLYIDKAPDAPLMVDALVTDVKGLNLTVKTADCAPILLVDANKGIIGAVHAGWRGAFQGIIETTILKMQSLGADIKDITAGIGPHIQLESFEADEKMKALFPVTEHHFFKATNEAEKYHFDFNGYLIHRLRRIGIHSIASAGDDTFTDENYLSYRRDPQNPARQYSFIALK